MATKTKTFDLFGVTYRTTQFTAIRALAIMGDPNTPPLVNLSQTQVYVQDRGWVAMDTRESVNEHVVDRMCVIPPRMALQKLLNKVNDYSFGFTMRWKGVKIPSRFRSGGEEAKQSSHVDPMIAQLLQEEVATLRELEEYYSLEDAFAMFDVMVAKGVNEAIANEAAAKKTR
jgi:hypothetical protein